MPAFVNFLHVAGRRAEQFVFCDLHGKEHAALHQQQTSDFNGRAITSIESGHWLECDVQLLTIFLLSTPRYGYVELKEVSGDGVFSFKIDSFVAYALFYAICDLPFPTPLTHSAMLECIHALDGNLRQVEVFELSQKGPVIGANVQVDLSSGGTTIQMRASDAITLATLDDKPIFISGVK